MKICIYHSYNYPNFKSLLKTYFLKLFGFFLIVNGKLAYATLYGGEVWTHVADFQISKDKDWIYTIEITQGKWCKQRQIMFMKKWRH